MKAFWASIILFFILLSLITINTAYIRNSANQLRHFTAQLPNSTDRHKILSDLNSFWESRRTVIGLSVSFREVDRVSDTIDCLLWAQSVGDELDFQKHLLLLEDAIAEIERSERFSVESIF